MGEIADIMLDGTMCSQCGEFLDGGRDGPGFPGLCASCADGDRSAPRRETPFARVLPDGKSKPKRILCPECGKKYRGAEGLAMHARDKHRK